MLRIVSILTAAVFALSLASVGFAKDKDQPKGANVNASTMGKKMSSQCAPGKRWVKPFKKKDGTWVKGYCRK
jgi:hypothetical protein